MAKVWLITGSGNGLGRDIAEAALVAGDNVVAGARRTEELAPLVAQHGERGRHGAVLPEHGQCECGPGDDDQHNADEATEPPRRGHQSSPAVAPRCSNNSSESWS